MLISQSWAKSPISCLYSAITKKKWVYNMRNFMLQFLGSIVFVFMSTLDIISECSIEKSISYSFCGAELREGVCGFQDPFRVMSPMQGSVAFTMLYLVGFFFCKDLFLFFLCMIAHIYAMCVREPKDTRRDYWILGTGYISGC